ncbi:hypothetical protein Tco_1211145 [Tanacetum coccineum]
MHANKSFNRNHANHRLYHALKEALIEDENTMDKGVTDTMNDHKRKHDDEDDDDEDHPAGPNQGKKTKRRRTKESESSKKPSSTKETSKGKTPTKGSKTGKSASTKEPVKEPITEVIMDDAGDDVARNDNLPQDTSKPKTRKTLNLEWFNQPPRPPTSDPEWNKHQVVLNYPTQPWFNQMVFALKDPLTFNDLIATPIDFSKYVLNGLKIENLTQDILLGLAFNLLKGTCSSSIELKYNFQECFNAFTNKLDWNNPEGDCYPFDLSKPLHLQGPPDVADSLHVPLNGYSPKQKQFSLMWLASSSASSNPLILIFYFFIYLIQKLRQKEVDEESCMKTCSMNWGEANLVYTSYIVSSASNGKIQAGALIFVLVGYITKAARYEIKGIKDMVPTLWSTIKHAYDKDALMGIKHWGERRKLCVKKLHGYGHLEEIVVKISDPQLYMFKEGDFVDLHLNDIEDMLLLAVQHKLFNLEGEWGAISNGFKVFVPTIQPELEGSTRDIPLVSVEVHRYDIKRSKSKNKGIVPTEIELVLEQTQKGTSHEVSHGFAMVVNGLPYVNALASRPLVACDLGVVTPRALVYAGVMISEDARLWYMISGDAKS